MTEENKNASSDTEKAKNNIFMKIFGSSEMNNAVMNFSILIMSIGGLISIIKILFFN